MSVICVSAVCGNEQCEQYEQDVLAEVDLRELPDGWGSFDGDFGVCEHCGAVVHTMFDLYPEDLMYVD